MANYDNLLPNFNSSSAFTAHRHEIEHVYTDMYMCSHCMSPNTVQLCQQI